MTVEEATKLVLAEFKSASEKHGAFHNLHEGYAVLLKEVDELWDEIKMSPGLRLLPCVREEAVQVAAMALRILVDCCEVEQ